MSDVWKKLLPLSISSGVIAATIVMSFRGAELNDFELILLIIFCISLLLIISFVAIMYFFVPLEIQHGNKKEFLVVEESIYSKNDTENKTFNDVFPNTFPELTGKTNLFVRLIYLVFFVFMIFLSGFMLKIVGSPISVILIAIGTVLLHPEIKLKEKTQKLPIILFLFGIPLVRLAQWML